MLPATHDVQVALEFAPTTAEAKPMGHDEQGADELVTFE